MKLIRFWLNNARWASLPQSLLPAAAAFALAAVKQGARFDLGILALLGVCAAHLSLNLLDDYCDWHNEESGYRGALARAGFRAFTKKCPYLQQGEASLKQLMAAVAAFGVIAILCGSVILWFRGISILIVAGITAILGVFYSGPPFRLSYHGLGELVIGVIFGPLIAAGVYLSVCGTYDLSAVILGLAMGLLVIGILYTHSILDLDADQSVGKMTLAGLIPTPKGRLIVILLLEWVPYVLLICGIMVGTMSLWYLLTLAAVPYGTALCRSMVRYTQNPDAPVTYRAWYGPMGDWTAIQKAGLDWFLLRWMLARNHLSVFALLWIIATILSEVVG